jgi:CheY-like chemotaxis protein
MPPPEHWRRAARCAILGDATAETGAVLDKSSGMRPATCAINDGLNGNTPEWRTEVKGKLRLAEKKSPRHVLVVDDEPLIRWSVAESLSDLGYDVEQASDAGSALRKVTTSALPYDVVVLDLRLPDMNDLSLLATLRQLLPRAALILMTAFGTPEIFADAEAMGAVVINKPFELTDLTSLVTGAYFS